jgi:hypothetical protein
MYGFLNIPVSKKILLNYKKETTTIPSGLTIAWYLIPSDSSISY